MLLALLLLAAPAPASVPASSQPAITRETRPELFRDEPPPRALPSGDIAAAAVESTTEFWLKMLLRTVIVLAVVVLLAYLILNKGMGRLMKMTGAGGKRSITVLERTALSQKHALFIIEVEGRRLLLGTAEAGVALLAELQQDGALPDLRDSAPASVMKGGE